MRRSSLRPVLTSSSYAQLAGNAGGLVVSALICFISTAIWPDHYDFEQTRTHDYKPRAYAETVAAELKELEFAPVADSPSVVQRKTHFGATPDVELKDDPLVVPTLKMVPSTTMPAAARTLDHPQLDDRALAKVFHRSVRFLSLTLR